MFRSTANTKWMPFEACNSRNIDIDIISWFIDEFSRFINHQMKHLGLEECPNDIFSIDYENSTCDGKIIASIINVSPCFNERDFR